MSGARLGLHVMPMSPTWASVESARVWRRHAFNAGVLLRVDVDHEGNALVEVIAATDQRGAAGANTLVTYGAPQPQSP